MMEQSYSRPGEIESGSNIPPLKPDLKKVMQHEQTKRELEDSFQEQSDALKDVVEDFFGKETLKPPQKSADPISGIRSKPRQSASLPDSPLSVSGVGNVKVDPEVSRENPDDHEWAA